jgi:hypothetical protein
MTADDQARQRFAELADCMLADEALRFVRATVPSRQR